MGPFNHVRSSTQGHGIRQHLSPSFVKISLLHIIKRKTRITRNTMKQAIMLAATTSMSVRVLAISLTTRHHQQRIGMGLMERYRVVGALVVL